MRALVRFARDAAMVVLLPVVLALPARVGFTHQRSAA